MKRWLMWVRSTGVLSVLSVKCCLLVGLLMCMGLSAHGAWYWPFDFDRDSTNKPPRLHRLLEKANDYIELAEDHALQGEGDKAIEQYREALRELDRVEEENPDRAESPEFAPLRNKRATCAAAIDAIRFAQINANERAVSVTNTSKLERKWRKKHKMETPEDLEEERIEAAEEKIRSIEKKTKDPEYLARVDLAVKKVRNGNYSDAEVILVDLDEEVPDQLRVLLLLSAVQVGMGRNKDAQKTLERAVKSHPKSYLPYYNLANLAMRLGEDKSVIRKYYEQGRALGGPQQVAMETLLK